MLGGSAIFSAGVLRVTMHVDDIRHWVFFGTSEEARGLRTATPLSAFKDPRAHAVAPGRYHTQYFKLSGFRLED